MKDKIIETIEEHLEGVSSSTLNLIAGEINELYADVDSSKRVIDLELLTEILNFLKKLKNIHSTLEPQTTEDIITVNDLNVAEYKIEILINKLV